MGSARLKGVDAQATLWLFRLMSQEDAKRFRAQAEECRHEAEKAISQDAAEAWLRLAGDWIRLAQ